MGLLEDMNSQNGNKEKPTLPSEIFTSLNQHTGYDYLRTVQSSFLDKWYTKRNQHDIIGVLGTGTGKTLIGLLTLQSQLNNNNGPCAYICQTKQLVNQVVKEAKNFGIKVTTFSESDPVNIPSDFINSEAILIMTFDKLFNGRSIFGVDTASYIKINSLVIDDAHVAINKIRTATTLTINRNSKEYIELLDIFEKDLNDQRPSKLDAIKNYPKANAVLKVPYWTIDNNKETILKILSSYALNDENNSIQYPFILESQDLLEIYVSYHQIDIRPQHVPVDMIPSFSKAKNRLFLSATVSNIGEFVSELSVDLDAVNNPISVDTLSDTGQKWILACTKVHPFFTDKVIQDIITFLSKTNNVLILVPSNYAAKKWTDLGARLYNASQVNQLALDFKQSNNFGMAVLANKYDGIDLPEDLCHITVIDGVPNQMSVGDHANAQRNPDSLSTDVPVIRELEQGMGRAVRSKADYSLIFLLGNKLQDLIYSKSNLLTSETLSQWKFFKELADNMKKNYPEVEDAKRELGRLIMGVISQDDGWSAVYKEKVNQYYNDILSETKNIDYSTDLVQKEAWNLAYEKDYESAIKKIRNYYNEKNIDIPANIYETLATYEYKIEKSFAFDLQKKAHSLSSFLLKSPNGSYSKRRKITGGEGANLIRYITKNNFSDSNDLAIRIRAIVEDLVYLNVADETAFRNSIQRLGEILGFDSSQPESESQIREGGPDNLWLSIDKSILIEDKNQRVADCISKDDIEQITTSSTWFKKKYQVSDFSPVIFHKSNLISKDAHTDYDVRIVNQTKLEELINAVTNFSNRINQKALNYWNVDNLQDLFHDTGLLRSQFVDKYTVPMKKI